MASYPLPDMNGAVKAALETYKEASGSVILTNQKASESPSPLHFHSSMWACSPHVATSMWFWVGSCL